MSLAVSFGNFVFVRVAQIHTALEPELANAYKGRGNVYFQQGAFADAIAECDRASAISPLYADAFHDRALAYSYLGEHELAKADID